MITPEEYKQEHWDEPPTFWDEESDYEGQNPD